MTTAISSRRLTDLLRLLAVLETLHQRLAKVLAAKLQAVRDADMHAAASLAPEEQAVASRIQEQDGLRRQLMDVIGVELGLPARAGRTLTISQLSSKVRDDQCVLLGKAADRLMREASRVASASRVLGQTCRGVLHHLEWVSASLRPRQDKPQGYSGAGRPVAPCDAKVFETIG